MEEYHKIKGIYERDHNTKKLIEGKFTDGTLEFLKDNTWEFTEKIDGTNIRVIWDGHKVTFAGRTDKALIPVELVIDFLNFLVEKQMSSYLSKNLEHHQ